MSEDNFLSDEEVDYLLGGCSEEYSQEYKVKKAAATVKKQRYDQFYMDMALRCAAMSYGIRAKVGTVIVKNDNIISMGWNGMPAGMPNDCEDRVYSTKVETGILGNNAEFPYAENMSNGHYRRYKLVTKPEVLHAEQNAICKAAKSGTALKGAELYVTLSPCMHCAAMIYNSGISRVVYQQDYNSTGAKFLKDRGVVVEQLVPEINT